MTPAQDGSDRQCPAHADDPLAREFCRWCGGSGSIVDSERYDAACKVMDRTTPEQVREQLLARYLAPDPADALRPIHEPSLESLPRTLRELLREATQEADGSDTERSNENVTEIPGVENDDREHLSVTGMVASLCNTPPLCNALEALIASAQPQRAGRYERHRRLLDLARGLKFDFGIGDPDDPTAWAVLQRWSEHARAVLGDHPFSALQREFRDTHQLARRPLGDDLVRRSAEGARRESDPLKRMAAFCLALSRAHPMGLFFISAHEAAKHLGFSWPMRAWRLLKKLETVGVLVCVERGVPGKPGGRATRYQHTGAKLPP